MVKATELKAQRPDLTGKQAQALAKALNGIEKTEEAVLDAPDGLARTMCLNRLNRLKDLLNNVWR